MTSGVGAFYTSSALGAFIALVGIAGFLVLWFDSPQHTRWRELVLRWNMKLTGNDDMGWMTAPVLSLSAAVCFAMVVIVGGILGGYECTSAGPPDIITLVTSGRAFWSGGNPFTISACGVSGNPVPAGMASVLLDAIGSLGGPVGILVVWGAVSVAIVPLLWTLGGPQRALATVFVLLSFVYMPIVAVQIDGASLALVPFTVLLVLYIARKGWGRAAAVGGFLATGRFPALFPVMGATGRARSRRVLALVISVAVFGAITLLCVAIYGSDFTGPVFLIQFNRGGLALNYWGILEGLGWVKPSTALTVVQAVLTLGLVGACWMWARTELGAVAIVLTGTLLLAQFLSFNELVFLVPVALLGSRPRWWIWAIGIVGSTNFFIGMRSLGGVPIFSYVLDLFLTGLLLGLLIDLVRKEMSFPSALSSAALARA
jgi:hypothetical protein